MYSIYKKDGFSRKIKYDKKKATGKWNRNAIKSISHFIPLW